MENTLAQDMTLDGKIRSWLCRIIFIATSCLYLYTAGFGSMDEMVQRCLLILVAGFAVFLTNRDKLEDKTMQSSSSDLREDFKNEASNVGGRGMIDRMTGCGDVNIICGGRYSTADSTGSNNFSIRDIPDYQEVFQLVRRMQTDIYADTMYPNALRPDNNPGYNTQYQPTDRRH